MRLDTSTDPQVGYRPPGTLDANPLDEFRGTFGRRQAAHLLRRAGFGGAPAEIDALSSQSMEAAVATLLHPARPDLDFAGFPGDMAAPVDISVAPPADLSSTD